MYHVGYFNHGTTLRFIMLLAAGAFLGAIPVAVLLVAWIVFSACSDAFRKRTIPAFATGVIHNLLLGFGLYLGLWLDSCGAARPGAGLGPDDPEAA